MVYSSNINFKSLDALRGLLAIYVLLFHTRWLLWSGQNVWIQHNHAWWSNILAYSSGILRYGHEAVIVFFVLSGFFIHLRVAQQLASQQLFQIDVIKFLQRRCHRLVTPYFFVLILTLLFDVVGRLLAPKLYTAQTGDALLDLNFQKSVYSWDSVLPALIMLPRSLGKNFGSNGPLWSLAYEVVFYLIYPAWLLIRRLGVMPAYGTGILIMLISMLIPVDSFAKHVLIDYSIWLAGAGLAEILTRHELPKWSSMFGSLCLVIAFIAINVNSGTQLSVFINAVFGFTIVCLTANLPISLCIHRVHRAFEMLGLESYTIYICHFPILTLLSAFVFALNGERPLHGWLALGSVPVTLFLCHFFFLVCERHFIHARIKANS